MAGKEPPRGGGIGHCPEAAGGGVAGDALKLQLKGQLRKALSKDECCPSGWGFYKIRGFYLVPSPRETHGLLAETKMGNGVAPLPVCHHSGVCRAAWPWDQQPGSPPGPGGSCCPGRRREQRTAMWVGVILSRRGDGTSVGGPQVIHLDTAGLPSPPAMANRRAQNPRRRRTVSVQTLQRGLGCWSKPRPQAPAWVMARG